MMALVNSDNAIVTEAANRLTDSKNNAALIISLSLLRSIYFPNTKISKIVMIVVAVFISPSLV